MVRIVEYPHFLPYFNDDHFQLIQIRLGLREILGFRFSSFSFPTPCIIEMKVKYLIDYFLSLQSMSPYLVNVT